MNWFRRLIGGADDRKPSRANEPELREPEFKPAKLPPRRPEVSQKAEEPSELNWFELQVSPHEFRFAVATGRDGLIAFKRDRTSNCETNLLRAQDNESNIQLAFSVLNELLQKHDILKTPVHLPENAFQEATLPVASMHLRFRYGKSAWASWYLASEIPSNVQALFEDCYQLTVSMMARSPGRRLSSEEVLEIIKEKSGQ